MCQVSSRFRIWIAPLCCTLVLAGRNAIALADAAPGTGYLDALDQLQAGQWAAAETSAGRAISPDDAIASHYLIRGVAAMLAGDTQQAAADLQLANTLDPKDIQGRRWLEALLRSTGQTRELSHIRGGIYHEPSDAHGSGHHSQTLAEAAEALRSNNADARAAIERFAIALAADQKARPEVFDLLYRRMAEGYAAGNYAATLRDLSPLMAARPIDTDLLFKHAACLRNTGRYADARAELTRVLTDRPEFAAAYSERAITQAHLGNLVRAKSDFALSGQFDPKDAKEMAAEFNKAIALLPVDPATLAPADQFAALRAAAERGQSVTQLVPLATSLVQCMNAHRLRWDEGYQDRIRELDLPIQANKKDTAAILAFGLFVYREANIFGEHAGPGAPVTGYRYEGNNQPERELSLAERNFNEVLLLDPKNAEAMVWKSAIAFERSDWDTARDWIDKARAIKPDLPELLEILIGVMNVDASMQRYQAVGLRMSHSWTEYGELFDTEHTRNPTKEELAQADALDRQAQQLYQTIQTDLAKAAAKLAGTADGFYSDGILKSRNNDIEGACASFLQAWQKEKSRRNTDALADTLMRAKQADYAVTTRFKFALTRQTTITPLIAAAWVNIDRGTVDKAQTFLDDALPIDPADGRIPAYQAAIAMSNGKPEIALPQLNMSLAIEEANALLNGESLLTGKTPLAVDVVARSMMLNLRAAARAKAAGKLDEAAAYLNQNLLLASRVSSTQFATPSFNSILPYPGNPTALQPRSVGNLTAWTHILLAYTRIRQNQFDEAERQFQIVWNWPKEPRWFCAQQRALAGLMRLKSGDSTKAIQPRGLDRNEIERASDSPIADNATIRRYAEDSSFNRSNDEDLTVPDASLATAGSLTAGPGQDAGGRR